MDYSTVQPTKAKDSSPILVYVHTRLEPQWKTDTASEYFANAFAKFTANDFKLLNADVRSELGNLLCNRGFYVPKGGKVFISNARHAVVEDKLPWPENEHNHKAREAAVRETKEQ